MGAPDFKLKDLTTSQLTTVKVVNKSAGRDQGRRFELVYTDETGTVHHSKELVFRDIYNKIDKLAHKEIKKGNLENLQEIEKFLVDLKVTEFEAAEDYEIQAYKNRGYKILTWIHRLFAPGSHQDKMNGILRNIGDYTDLFQKKNTDTISKLNINSASTEASLDEDLRFVKELKGEVRDEYLGKMATEYMRLNLPDKGLEVAQLMTDELQKESLFADVSRNYIDAGDLQKASEIRKLVPGMRNVLEQYAAYKAILQSIERDSFVANDLDQVLSLEQKWEIFEKFIEKGNLAHADLVISRLDPTYQNYAAYKLVDKHMKDKHYTRAIVVAANSPNKQVQLQFVAQRLFEEAPKNALDAINEMDDGDNKYMCQYELSKNHLEKNRLDDAFEVASTISDYTYRMEILKKVIEAYARNNQFDKVLNGVALFHPNDPIRSKLILEVCQPNNDLAHALELKNAITSDDTHRQLMAKWPALYEGYVSGEYI